MKRHKSFAANVVTALVIAVVFLTVGIGPVQDAVAKDAVGPGDDWTELIAQEGSWAKVITGEIVPADFADLRFDELTKSEWKRLRADLIEGLRSEDSRAWEETAQKVIYLAVFQSEKVDLNRANVPLYDVYNLGRNETHRIMALAAIHAIGHHDTLAHVAQDVRLEASPRVKRLSAAAVVDYFDLKEPSVQVEEPTAIPNR